MASGEKEKFRPVAQNRRARHDYHIEETIEAGLVLTGPEVKSLREGRSSINEAYAGEEGGELYLFNAYIPEYRSSRATQEPRRKRKLLLHKKQISRLVGAISREGMTIVPLSLYFNERGRAKASLGLAHGKKKADKRASIKERDWKREKARLVRHRG